MAERSWTLTGRMAWIFALTTSALLALHAGFSAWFVLGAVHDDVRNFLDHETQEFVSFVQTADLDKQSWSELTESMADVAEEPSCAFRVRSEAGKWLAESGDPRLLAAVAVPLGLDDSWRSRLLSDGLASSAVVEPLSGMRLEVLVDARHALARIRRFLSWAAVVLLVSVALAGLAGWFTASHGLAQLREVVATAGSVAIPTAGTRLELDGAPQEVRAVGQALNGMLDRIDEGLTTMRTFTAGLAHELRSPLQNLIGETEVALLRHRDAGEYQTLLRSNLSELQALSDAVDNMVAYCRNATPEGPASELESFDLGEEMRLRVSRDVTRARAEGVELLVETEGDGHLCADREACLRVVRNLVANAVHWSPPQSTVQVLVREAGDAVELVVADQGPGVPEALEPRIFEPFVSGRPRSGSRSGYGLGLSICRTVMLAHGGTLEYERQQGAGARFVARFPRTAGSAQAG